MAASTGLMRPIRAAVMPRTWSPRDRFDGSVGVAGDRSGEHDLGEVVGYEGDVGCFEGGLGPPTPMATGRRCHQRMEDRQ